MTWHFVREGCVIEDADGTLVARLVIARTDNEFLDETELHARGQVIAAARQLRTALQKIVNNWDDLHGKDLLQARVALAAAEGK